MTTSDSPSSEPRPRYFCMVDGCPGEHPSKWGVCASLTSKNLLDQVRMVAHDAPINGEYIWGDICRKAADEIERLQAEIDALMLEFCPGRMTTTQLAEWARHQRPAHEPSEFHPRFESYCRPGTGERGIMDLGEHDVKMRVDGLFDSDEQKRDYCEELAARLSKAPAVETSEVPDDEDLITIIDCPHCDGQGHEAQKKCVYCDGTGLTESEGDAR